MWTFLFYQYLVVAVLEVYTIETSICCKSGLPSLLPPSGEPVVKCLPAHHWLHRSRKREAEIGSQRDHKRPRFRSKTREWAKRDSVFSDPCNTSWSHGQMALFWSQRKRVRRAPAWGFRELGSSPGAATCSMPVWPGRLIWPLWSLGCHT